MASAMTRRPSRRRSGARRRQREEQIVDAMTGLRRHHPRVFNALVTIIAHVDVRTLDAVAELVDFVLCVEAGALASSTLREGAGEHRAPR